MLCELTPEDDKKLTKSFFRRLGFKEISKGEWNREGVSFFETLDGNFTVNKGFCASKVFFTRKDVKITWFIKKGVDLK